MSNLTSKRRMASQVLGVGINRIRFDETAGDSLEDAITRGNIRALIKDGVIWTIQKKGISRGRIRAAKKHPTKRGKTAGRREGAKYSRTTKKERWMLKVRALRNRLKILKDRGEITNELYWRTYRTIGGGQVRSIRHMNDMIKTSIKR
ncbi:MAG: 50S ribosomal protein L19e [Nitrososphaerales archaeon]